MCAEEGVYLAHRQGTFEAPTFREERSLAVI
jgi:hypothetical protein